MLQCSVCIEVMRAALLSVIVRRPYIERQGDARTTGAHYRENAMSQSIRTPGGIAIRAVAAASLFASKPKAGGSEGAAAETEKEADARKLKIRAGLKPAPKA